MSFGIFYAATLLEIATHYRNDGYNKKSLSVCGHHI